MNNVMRYDKSDFADMVTITARETGLREAIIEKDFWVCAILDYLFHRCAWDEVLSAGMGAL